MNENRSSPSARALANQPPPSGGMNVGDIYYVLFRHKWKIIGISSLGLIAAIVTYVLSPASYVSEAKLYIKFVQDASRSTGPVVNDANVSLDRGGETIINTEIAILTSRDVIQKAVELVGAEK